MGEWGLLNIPDPAPQESTTGLLGLQDDAFFNKHLFLANTFLQVAGSKLAGPQGFPRALETDARSHARLTDCESPGEGPKKPHV